MGGMCYRVWQAHLVFVCCHVQLDTNDMIRQLEMGDLYVSIKIRMLNFE